MPNYGAPTSGVPNYGMPGPGGYPGGPGAGWPGGPPLPPPKRSRTGLIVGIVLVVLVVLCGGGVVAVFAAAGNKSKDTPVAAGASGQPSPSVSPSPTPISVADYQDVLAKVDALMAPAWQQVTVATNRTSTAAAATALAKAAKDSEEIVVYVRPPAEAQSGHDLLKQALSASGNGFTDLALTVDQGSVCGGASAVSQVTSSPAANNIRDAVKAFGTTFKFGAWMPPPVAPQTRKLANGAFVKKGNLNGSGEFTVNNTGAPADVVVSLVPTGTKTASTTFWVGAGETFKLKHVRDGNYDVYMASGEDWDAGIGGFTRKCDLQKFTDPIEFKTTSRQYTTWEITMKAAAGGNAQTDPVDAADYPQ